VLGLLAFFFQAACGQLEPLNLPSESAVPAEEAGPLSVVETVARQNWQIPLNTGRDALEWRLRAIDSAVGSLDLQTFLWLDDTVGNLFKERILKAADRGVKVRILIDDSFLAGQDQSSLRLGAHPNISYRVYNPYGRRSNSTVSRTVLNLGEFSRLDHRMHNKLMVADGHVAIIGGRNLADEYFGMDPQSNFRDMELLVGGPIISDLEASFDSYWNDRWAFPIEKLARLQTQNVSINEFAAKAKTASTEFPSETAALSVVRVFGTKSGVN
jgi:putative cardiolipin synthase